MPGLWQSRRDRSPLKSAYPYFELEPCMSAPTPESKPHDDTPVDGVEAIVPLMPIVLPIVGGVLMFLLAFIAVSMA
jgi:hypothetical protein